MRKSMHNSLREAARRQTEWQTNRRNRITPPWWSLGGNYNKWCLAHETLPPAHWLGDIQDAYKIMKRAPSVLEVRRRQLIGPTVFFTTSTKQRNIFLSPSGNGGGRFPHILDIFQGLKIGVSSGCLGETSIFTIITTDDVTLWSKLEFTWQNWQV